MTDINDWTLADDADIDTIRAKLKALLQHVEGNL